jgi:5'-deoxynucleotidase YfbR-like HD superfamily hydrolase
MNKFEIAKSKIAEIIAQSKTEEDPSHSLNTSHWLLVLKPDADDILQLAALSHDIERAMPDRLTSEQFPTYEEYKIAHANKAAELAAQILKESGYSDEESARIFTIIKDAETGDDNPEVNLIMDADSISFFDNNIDYYIKRKSQEDFQAKAEFMYNRASDQAKQYIREIMAKKPEINIELK